MSSRPRLPRLHDDVRYGEFDGGVKVSNTRGAVCVLRGAGVFELVDRLAPKLRGEVELSAIVAGLEARQQSAVYALVEALAARSLLSDAAEERSHTLDNADLAVYADEIAFVRYTHDSAAWRFQQLRDALIVLRGSGPVFAELLRVGLRSGWRQVSVLTGDDPAAIEAAVSAARRDPRQNVTVSADHAGRDDLVLEVAGVPIVRLWPGRNEARIVIQPVNAVDTASEASPAERYRPDDPAVAAIAAHMGLACFRILTKTTDSDARVLRIDLSTLTTDMQPVRGDLGKPSPGDLPQVPISVWRAELHDGPAVLGWGDTAALARRAAQLHACCADAFRQHAGSMPMPVGVAAGESWAQARAAALSSLATAFLPAPVAAPELQPPDDLGRLLEAASLAPEFHQHPVPPGISAYSVRTDDGHTGLFVGGPGAAAIRHAAEWVLLCWQLGRPVDPARRWAVEDEDGDALVAAIRHWSGRAPVVTSLTTLSYPVAWARPAHD